MIHYNPSLISAELNRIRCTARELIRVVPPDAQGALVNAIAHIAAADAMVAKAAAHPVPLQTLNPKRN